MRVATLGCFDPSCMDTGLGLGVWGQRRICLREVDLGGLFPTTQLPCHTRIKIVKEKTRNKKQETRKKEKIKIQKEERRKEKRRKKEQGRKKKQKKRKEGRKEGRKEEEKRKKPQKGLVPESGVDPPEIVRFGPFFPKQKITAFLQTNFDPEKRKKKG